MEYTLSCIWSTHPHTYGVHTPTHMEYTLLNIWSTHSHTYGVYTPCIWSTHPHAHGVHTPTHMEYTHPHIWSTHTHTYGVHTGWCIPWTTGTYVACTQATFWTYIHTHRALLAMTTMICMGTHHHNCEEETITFLTLKVRGVEL